MNLDQNLTKFLGFYKIFIPVYLLGIVTLLYITYYCKLNGPNDIAQSISFTLPMAMALIMCMLALFSQYFWRIFFIYGALLFILMIISLDSFRYSLDDPTGFGATMFNSLVSMYIFGAALYIHILKMLYRFIKKKFFSSVSS